MIISWTFKIEIYVDIKSWIVLADYIGKISSSASRTFIRLRTNIMIYLGSLTKPQVNDSKHIYI